MKTIDVLKLPLKLCLGRRGEKNFRPIQVEWSAWKSSYPNASLNAVYLDPTGKVTTVATSNETPLVIVQSEAITKASGFGQMEFKLTDNNGETIGKSTTVVTVVAESISDDGDDSGGGDTVEVEPLNVTENGTYTAILGKAYSPVVVNVPQSGGSDVTVEPLTITANGTYTAPSGKAYSPVTVNTPTSEDGEEVWFDDRNDYVKGYLTASENYTAANRSTVSVIGNYADHAVQDQDCPKPFLGSYNLFPNVENEVGAWEVNRFDYAPRMIKLQNVWNVRDIGGWSCDGGEIAYGKIFRGARLDNSSAPATTADLNFLASLGIKLDLDIRDQNNASHAVQIPGADYLNVPITEGYAPMINNEATAAANACKAAMESVVANKPVYIHCASGADRTGCICGMLEAILGVGARDIDRDYELTSFADVEPLGTNRAGGNWLGFWAALPTSQETVKMNVVRFLLDNGVTLALINSFRRAIIDGNPSDINLNERTITNNLTGCTTSNNASSVTLNASYSATITPNSGYTLISLTVTMGGVDITSTAVSVGTITIASVTGNVVITALAEAQTSYTNLVRQATAFDSNDIFNGVGYKNGYYKPDGTDANACLVGCIPYVISNVADPTDVLFVAGYTGSPSASHARMWIRRADKTGISEYQGWLSTNPIFDIEVLGTGYYKLTPKVGIHSSYNNIEYLNFSFAQPDGANIIITKNDPIE